MSPPFPRLVIAGTGGDSGKTLVSLGLLLAWRRRGLVTAAFKKGPDYIDRSWLAWASGMAARNLDAFLMERDRLVESFCDAASGARVSVIEGNRGLHDGLDGLGTYSTAELAKLLGAPVVLLLDATKVTRTAAAVALGCQQLDPQCHVAGVILNRVAGPRHERVLRESVRRVTGLPVLGVIRRHVDLGALLPDRHLGLVTPQENPNAEALEARLVSLAEESLELDRLLAVADEAAPLQLSLPTRAPSAIIDATVGAPVRLAYFSDAAFTFYYPENLSALERAGAELVPVSALADDHLPEVDGLYIGGGFPETQAAALAANQGLKRAVRKAAVDDLPIYAECGGLMYLSESFTWLGSTHVMAGVLPLKLAVEKRPQGHGYMEVEVDRENPIFARGTRLRGHEFHYSRVVESTEISTAYRVERGVGTGQDRDGLLKGSVLASYLHLHALGSPSWAPSLVAAARRYRDCK
ncbi:MAG: cobyrinate a,c-diamide synthase [bacterium]